MEKREIERGELDGLEEAIETLKVAYERYFHGVDKIPPLRAHDGLKRQLRGIMRNPPSSTALRFRFQSLRARLISCEQRWHRIMNQIEKGTFKRVLAESKRREFVQQEERRSRGAGNEEGGKEGNVPTLPPGMDAKQARALFKEFVQAKRAVGEKTAGLTYGALVGKLANELPRLQKKHGGDLRFEVATVDGKVKLRARRG